MKNTKKMLSEKMQVKLPEALSTENIMANIENSKAEIVEMPKKKNMAKKLVPMVASLLLVVGIVGIYASLQQKDVPVTDNDDKTDVMEYQSYDKIYERFDELHKEAKKQNNYNLFGDFFYADGEDEIADESVAENMGASATGSTATDDAGLVTPDSLNGPAGSTDRKEHGTTNTQEKDVDEGDIIKTDGNYLYIANSDSNKSISIVDVSDKKMKEASEIKIKDNETIGEIYINGDKLVAIGHLYRDSEEKTAGSRRVVEDCIVYLTSDTFVKVYDISDRTKPKLVTEFSQQGTYDNSRMIGTKLYTISDYPVNVYDDDYRDICIPEITINDVCATVPADGIHVVEESNSTTYAVITTLDLSKDSDPESEAILGECNHLYASSKGLFLSETTGDGIDDYTKIYKFDYTDTGVKHMCTGKVPGYINNQFSMSYDGEYFRIATTDNNVESNGETVSFSIENRTNNLYILNNQMQEVGKVEDLAKGEMIESVRFVGNMAYVVTFRQTDPLFVIDLTDPTKPTVKGELKIPGFSEYLHPIADGLLVGVGQDGTNTGTNGDCKVSLFDVTNPYEPKESSLLKVADGKGYCYSAISYNHKVYIKLSDNEFAVPFSIRWYVSNDKTKAAGDYYIRYRLTGDGLCEVARYYVGNDSSSIMGATFVEDVLYVVTNNYEKGTCVTAFDLVTNERLDTIQTGEWK